MLKHEIDEAERLGKEMPFTREQLIERIVPMPKRFSGSVVRFRYHISTGG